MVRLFVFGPSVIRICPSGPEGGLNLAHNDVSPAASLPKAARRGGKIGISTVREIEPFRTDDPITMNEKGPEKSCIPNCALSDQLDCALLDQVNCALLDRVDNALLDRVNRAIGTGESRYWINPIIRCFSFTY